MPKLHGKIRLDGLSSGTHVVTEVATGKQHEVVVPPLNSRASPPETIVEKSVASQ